MRAMMTATLVRVQDAEHNKEEEAAGKEIREIPRFCDGLKLCLAWSGGLPMGVWFK